MKKRNVLGMLFLLLNLFVGTPSLVLAVPLSLDQNINAVLAHRADVSEGFDFIVTGDSRDGPEVYTRLLNRAKAFNPLFILHTGDIVSKGRPAEYENYIKQVAPCDIPILHVAGNHDIKHGQETFRNYVGVSNWQIDLGGFRIIGLDNATGKFSAETVAFARRAFTSNKICLVAFHMPPPVARWAGHAMIRDQKGGRGHEVMGLAKEARVPLVFLGHMHLYDEMDIDGTNYIISGGAGAPLSSEYGLGKSEFGFVLVRVRPEGITHRWVPVD